MPDDIRRHVQQQFGAHAQNFVTSKVHAQGRSLARLVELLNPQSDWRVLDIATGGGHTALALAPHVHRVIASDLTVPILQAAREFIGSQGRDNVAFCQTDAERLVFPDGIFQCITCRIAPHHFPDVAAFVREAARVLAPGGLLAVSDNIAPAEPAAAKYLNALEKLRDPSHHWCWSAEDWGAFFYSAGLRTQHQEPFTKQIDFDEWAERVGVEGDDRLRLRVMLRQAPDEARDWLQPQVADGRLTFALTEMTLIGEKSGS